MGRLITGTCTALIGLLLSNAKSKCLAVLLKTLMNAVMFLIKLQYIYFWLSKLTSVLVQ